MNKRLFKKHNALLSTQESKESSEATTGSESRIERWKYVHVNSPWGRGLPQVTLGVVWAAAGQRPTVEKTGGGARPS